MSDHDPDDQCHCVEPSDNDQGFCMVCGRWINYRERDQP